MKFLKCRKARALLSKSAVKILIFFFSVLPLATYIIKSCTKDQIAS